MVSNVEFKSNVYPVAGRCRDDKNFLRQIHDIFALERLNYEAPLYRRTSLQDEEYRAAALHCKHALANEYPWGTIVDGDGQARVVCKCEQFNCHLFKTCRPDYRPPTVEPEKVVEPEKIIPTAIEETPKKTPTMKKIAVPKIISVEQQSESTQEAIIKAASDEMSIVNGGPGTGKTFIVKEKIMHMIDVQGVAPDRILVFCFSRAAVDVIRARLSVDYAGVDIRTFDSFATYMLAAVEKIPLENLNYDGRIRRAIATLKRKPDVLGYYAGGHVLVDEVQDLVGVRAELVVNILKILPATCGFTLLGDSCQALYDYLAVDGVMSSAQFYAAVDRQFPTAKHYELSTNHRQSNRLARLTDEYRSKILDGDIEKCRSSLEEIKNEIVNADADFKNFCRDNAEQYDGTLGILTRNNAQALKISDWLSTNGVEHTLRRRTRNNVLDGWIAKIFCGYAHETISEKNFIERHREVYPDADEAIAVKRWAALLDTLKTDRNRYEVEEILRGLIKDPKADELFVGDRARAITVSNIHRSKGREFDSVILLDDLLGGDDKNLLEHKICYVGLTRAKARLETGRLDNRYIYFIPNENRRCYKVRRYRNMYLSNFEVGIEGDVDDKSFGLRAEVQEFIRRELQVGMALKLVKDEVCARDYVTYKILVEEPTWIELGSTDKIFAVELERAIRCIFKLWDGAQFDPKFFPSGFDNVRVEALTTCIGGGEVPAAATFGDLKIWSGLSIVGFANVLVDKF